MALSGIGGRLYRGEQSFAFIANRRRFYAFSLLLIIVSAAALGIQGLKLGIEFKGGSVFTVKSSTVDINAGHEALKSAGITTETVVQKIGVDKLRLQTGDLPQSTLTTARSSLASAFKVDATSIDVQTVGPSWGKEITHKAIFGLIGFLIVVMIYLAMAFEAKMAISAIIAVIHDVFITVGIYALVGFEVTPATVIGFLTILGYSLYDTVVVFDKVRENTKGITSTAKQTYSQAANLAINQTLVRSFNTSVIALLPVASILFVGAGLLGAGTLKDLSLALFIGLATGTYSSIFVATPILAQLHEREPAMVALSKRVDVRVSGGVLAGSDDRNTAGIVTSTHSKEDHERGPRNQPKRKPRRR